MQLNTKPTRITTHEGGSAARTTPAEQLRRTLMSCMLWERGFYEDGMDIATRLTTLAATVDPTTVAQRAIAARTQQHLRHAPLLLCRDLARRGKLTAATLASCIQRPDELTEFLAIYWQDKKQPLSAQVKKGLAMAFQSFSAYQLAKYNRDNAIKLRDVLFLCHAKPANKEQEQTWKQLIDGTLPTPDTWEVGISACKTAEARTAEWTRLLTNHKLGGLALLRNLRNATEAGVDDTVIRTALKHADTRRVLPFRYIAAARYAPRFEPELEGLMFKTLQEVGGFYGRTVLLIDVSGSMTSQLSDKSDMRRIDAACGLAMMLAQLCHDLRIYVFNETVREVPPRRGFALRDAIGHAGGGTLLANAIKHANALTTPYDRIICISDEQSQDGIAAPNIKERAYMLNVAPYQNGVAYGRGWLTINGFSEAILHYMHAVEDMPQ